MKKLFQKTIIATLTCLMLTFNFGFKQVDAISAQSVAATQEIGARVTEISENLMNLQILKALNIGGLAKGGCVFRSITGFVKMGFGILKLAGVFGPQKSQTEIIVEHFDNRFNAVDAKLDEIDKHLSEIEGSISEQLKLIGEDVTKISTTLSNQNITRVSDIAQVITKDIDNFDNLITSNIYDWYDLKNNPDYDRELNVTYITNDVDDQTTEVNVATVNLPTTLINEALNAVNKEWDVNNKENLLKEVFVKAINIAISNKEIYSNTYNDYVKYFGIVGGKDFGEATPEEISTNVAKLAEAAYDSLKYDCMQRIAKAKGSASDSYATDLVGQFNLYCDYLRSNKGYTSPLNSQYDIFTKIYAFQGELKCTLEYLDDEGKKVTEETDLADIARDYYFAELNQMGTYVAQIARASGYYTDDDLKTKIYTPWSESEAAMNEEYNNFYYVDVNGKDIDNYCYLTKTVLTYEPNNVEIRMHMSYEEYVKNYVFYTRHKIVSKDRELRCDWKFSIGNEMLASSNDLSRIYAYFIGKNGRMQTGPSPTFYEFLGACNVYDQKYSLDKIGDMSPLIITSFNGGVDLGSGDKIQMLAYPVSRSTNEKYINDNEGGKVYPIVNDKYFLEYVTGSTANMPIKRKALANTFNMLTGEAVTNNTVGAAAMFYEFYKNEDDMAMLFNADYLPNKYVISDYYGGVEDTVLDYNGSSAYGWPYSSSEVIYEKGMHHHYIDYLRKYGAVIENDVQVYKVNGEMSKTNSLVLANDYIKNLSFTENLPTNTSIVNEEDKTKHENVVVSQKEKFEKLMESLYPGKTEEIERLKANNSYNIIFNNDKYVNTDIETYQAMLSKLIDFLKPNTDGENENINGMVSTYQDMMSKIVKVVDIVKPENNDTGLKLSDSRYDMLIRSLLDYYLDEEYSICELISEIPTSKTTNFIYCKEDGIVYIWDGSKYIKGSDIDKITIGTIDGTVTKEVDNDEVFVFPSSNSKNVKVTFDIKPIIVFELYFDSDINSISDVDDANIKYDAVPYYDITPMISWEDVGGNIHNLAISNEVLRQSGMSAIPVKIPVLKLNDEKDTNALVYHFESMDQLLYPIDEYNPIIQTKNGVKYVNIRVKSFSPFTVKNTNYRETEKDNYSFPVTGIK